MKFIKRKDCKTILSLLWYRKWDTVSSVNGKFENFYNDIIVIFLSVYYFVTN